MRATLLGLCLLVIIALGGAAVAQATVRQSRAHAASLRFTKPVCPGKFQLRGNPKRGYICSLLHRTRKPRCVLPGRHKNDIFSDENALIRSGSGYKCLVDTSPPAFYGSITNAHLVSSNTVATTVTLTAKNCAGKYCTWYAHAFQIASTEQCNYGNGVQRWIVLGKPFDGDFTDTNTVTFIPAYGSVKICLYALGYVKEQYANLNVLGHTVGKEYLVAEFVIGQTTQGVTHPAPRTPLTVNNICSFNPGLGAHYPFKGPAGPGVFWDNNKDGIVDFGALSYEGDTTVDAAFVNDSHGKLTWIAHCYPKETPWINFAAYESAQSHPPPPQQTQPIPQQQQSQTPAFSPTGNTTQTLLDLTDATNKAVADPIDHNGDPSLGYTQPNNGGCDAVLSTCEVLP